MKPFELASDRLRLDLPVAADAERVFEYCQDPAIQRFTTVPSPYRREDAVSFLTTHVPSGWASGQDCTWALRETDGAPLLGVISLRRKAEPGTVAHRDGSRPPAWHAVLTREPRDDGPWPI